MRLASLAHRSMSRLPRPVRVMARHRVDLDDDDRPTDRVRPDNRQHGVGRLRYAGWGVSTRRSPCSALSASTSANAAMTWGSNCRPAVWRISAGALAVLRVGAYGR